MEEKSNESILYLSHLYGDTVALSAGIAGGPVAESWRLTVQLPNKLHGGDPPLEHVGITGGFQADGKLVSYTPILFIKVLG